MAYPVLFRFLENPSYLDHKQLGLFWMKKMNYRARWEEYRRTYNTFKTRYFIEDENSYYVHMLIPSNNRGNTYDVVIHFFTKSSIHATDYSLRNYDIEIFSNNPVFAFQFGYANHKAGIVIPFLAHKLSDIVLKTPAKKNNPSNAIGYDHSFYIAGMALMDSARLLNKAYIKEVASPFDMKELIKEVRSLEDVMAEYQDNKDKDANKKAFNKDKSLLDRAGEFIEDAKSKVGELVDRTFRSGSGSNVVKPSKSVGGKPAIKQATRKSATRSITTSATKAVKRKKPKRKI